MSDYAVSFFVEGFPRPKGSTRSWLDQRDGKIKTISMAKGLSAWTRAIESTASFARAEALAPLAERHHEIQFTAAFAMPRPKSIGDKDVPHTRTPDLDKLLRAAMDGCTGTVWADDCSVTKILTLKRFAKPREAPGVRITIDWTVPDDSANPQRHRRRAPAGGRRA